MQARLQAQFWIMYIEALALKDSETISICGAGRFLPQEFLDTNWVFYSLTQFWHCLHGIASDPIGLVLQDCPCSFGYQSPNPCFHLCFWSTGYRLGTLLGLINLLEWLTELGEAFYLLDPQFIMKAHTLGMARWMRCRGQVWRKGSKLPCPLQICHSPKISICSPMGNLSTWKFYKPLSLEFIWRFHCVDMVD